MRYRSTILFSIVILCSLSVSLSAQKAHRSKSRRHAFSSARKTTTTRPVPPMTGVQEQPGPIPMENSFKATEKRQRKVVIVPAPPPPPGNDPIPPKQNH